MFLNTSETTKTEETYRLSRVRGFTEFEHNFCPFNLINNEMFISIVSQ